MKIGILTRRYGYNMGSTLQAYAIGEMIKECGHSVEIIDYDETSAHRYWRIRPFIEHIFFYMHIPPFGFKREYLVHRVRQEQRFNKFETTYLPLTAISYSSPKELNKIASKYDKIVVGSDQIWNPFLFDSNFLGGFLNEEERNKIIPYAPSIGTSDIGTIHQEQRQLLKSLNVLACREEIGAKIINEITGRKVEVVLDPTLMISTDKWEYLANVHKCDIPNKRYILTYFLGNNIPDDEIKKQCKIENAEVINISMFNRPNGLKANFQAKDVGPGEFLYLIKNALYVLTDSFHATIFSWIFKRNFTVFERFNSSDIQNQNSRIYTLLRILGCEGRLYGGNLKDSEPLFNNAKKISLEYLHSNL